MLTYGVAMCNLDMAQTLERLLRRLLEQVDEHLEVVVVDGGSADGRVERLESLGDEFDSLTPMFLDRGPNPTLGENRNTACQHASGVHNRHCRGQ